MKRSRIVKRVDSNVVTLELDEEYKAGSLAPYTSHFFEEFASAKSGVTHRLAIRDLHAPGFLGFFYRRFGSSKMGRGFQHAYREYLEGKGTAP